MNYFAINGNDFSRYVNKLVITTKHKYTGRENAAGTLLVKYLAEKKNVQVGIIPLDASSAVALMQAINSFKCTVSFLDPETNSKNTINCIIPANTVEFYTIQTGNVRTKAFTFTCEEL